MYNETTTKKSVFANYYVESWVPIPFDCVGGKAKPRETHKKINNETWRVVAGRSNGHEGITRVLNLPNDMIITILVSIIAHFKKVISALHSIFSLLYRKTACFYRTHYYDVFVLKYKIHIFTSLQSLIELEERRFQLFHFIPFLFFFSLSVINCWRMLKIRSSNSSSWDE